MIRRSISISDSLNELLEFYFKKYSYKSRNDLIVELLELGIIKMNESNEIKTDIQNIKSDLRKIVSLLNEWKNCFYKPSLLCN